MMQQRSKHKWLGLALAAALLAGCGTNDGNGSAAEGGSASPQGSSDDPIKVGVIGAFSGSSADMGVAMQRGVEIATAEVNEAGGVHGRQIELVLHDDEGDPARATAGAQRMIDSENVSAVIGNPSTGTAIATVQVTNEREVPQVVPIAQSPEVLEGSPEWAFRITATNPMDIEALTDYIDDQGWQQVGLIHDTSAYGLSGEGLLREAIPAAGLDLVTVESYEIDSPNLTPQALNLREAGAEAVVMWSLGADGGRFVTNMADIGWEAPVLGGRGLLFEIFTSSGGAHAEGTLATGAFDADKPEAQEFAERYEDAYGTRGSIDFGVLGYDGARVLFRAMEDAGPEAAGERAAIRDALEAIEGFPLVSGGPDASASFSPEDHEGATPDAVVVVTHGAEGWSNYESATD